jgi:2-polyprenyl-3-methyl-5-hydroxy-6-metoxy-1,4-benzoquinol methylase
MTNTQDEANTIKESIFRMYGLIYGNWQTCITYAFAEMGIADLLHLQPKTVKDLKEETGTDERALQRFLRCAATLGFIKSDDESGEYSLTPFGEFLRSDHPYSQRAAARLNGAHYRYQPWGRLVDILKTGNSEGISPTYLRGTLEYLADKPELREVFHQAMSDLSAGQNDAIALSYDFNRFNHVIDIGCGQGNFIKAVLHANQHLKGTMFDLDLVPISEEEIESGSLAGRLSSQMGDFFEGVPIQGDVYIMKNVIHNWPENKALQLLQNVHTAMSSTVNHCLSPQEKRLLLIEYLIPEGDNFSIAKWLDLNFMILIDGAERTLKEYQMLVSRAGFVVTRTLITPVGRHIIELAIASSEKSPCFKE